MASLFVPAAPGQKGDKGDKGDQGIQGVPGTAGAQGVPGPSGLTSDGSIGVSNDLSQMLVARQPGISWTTLPTYDNSHGAFGSPGLATGVGSAPIVIGTSSSDGSAIVNVEFEYYASAASFAGSDYLWKITDSGGLVFGLLRNGANLAFNHAGNLVDTGCSMSIGQHHIQITIVGTTGGAFYSNFRFDGDGGHNLDNGTGNPLHAGAATLVVNMSNTSRAAGDVMDELRTRTGGDVAPPTTAYTSDATTTSLFHFDNSGVDSSKGVTTYPVVPLVDATMTADPVTGKLSTPMVGKMKQVLQLPAHDQANAPAGTNFAAQINAFILDCQNRGFNSAYLSEGHAALETTVVVPQTFELTGQGRVRRLHGYGGGVCLQRPYLGFSTPSYTGVSLAGPGGDGNNASQLHVSQGLRNISVLGGNANGYSLAGNMPLIDASNCMYLLMSDVYFAGDYCEGLRLSMTWDSDFYNLGSNDCGFSDPTASPTDATVQAYTGRTVAMEAETKLGHSLGVPVVRIYSPNTTGADNSNNLRFYSPFFESNPANAVQFMAYGGNTTAIRIYGGKIEAAEGQAPLIVLDQVSAFEWHGHYLYAAGTGYPYIQTGGVPAGAAWKNYTPDAAHVLATRCISPKFTGQVGYGGGGAPNSFYHFIDCEDPQVNASVITGIGAVTDAWSIYDNCGQTSSALNWMYCQNYVTGQAGANLTKRHALNGTTFV